MEIGKIIYRAFVDYAKAIYDCIETQVMAIVESAEQLPGEAEDIKNTAERDFEAMEMM